MRIEIALLVATVATMLIGKPLYFLCHEIKLVRLIKLVVRT